MPEGALLARGADLPGDDGDHAHDTEDDKQLLHHVGLAGIEPATSELSALRSNRLSYSPMTHQQRVTAAARRVRLPYPFRRSQTGWAGRIRGCHSFSASVSSIPPTRSEQTL